MPGAYSADLRQRVLRVCECGQVSRAKIAALFQVGETTLYRWQQEWRAEGRCRAKPHAGGPAPQLDAIALDKLKDLVAESNDLTLAEYAAKLAERARVAGERLDRVPGTAEAGTATQKRPCARKSRTGQILSRLEQVGVPSWPRSIRSTWSFWTRVGSIPA